MSNEREAEAYYEEMAERARYEDAVAARNADDWRHLTAERDTHAETLRVLLLREAGAYMADAADHLMAAESDHEDGFPTSASIRREFASVDLSMAGIAIILALMIGGER